jgi:hypothetical protein
MLTESQQVCFRTSLSHTWLLLHPSRDPYSSLISQRGKQKQVAPLCLPVPTTLASKRWEGASCFGSPCSIVRVWPFKYLLK